MISFTFSMNANSLINKYKERRLIRYPAAVQRYVNGITNVAKLRFIRESRHRRYVIGKWGKGFIVTRGKKKRQYIGPYSKRRPIDSGPTKDYQMNIQSGEYASGWFTQDVSCPAWGSHAYAKGIGNTAPHAKYLHTIGGAGWMRERRIVPVVTRWARRASRHGAIQRLHRRALGFEVSR